MSFVFFFDDPLFFFLFSFAVVCVLCASDFAGGNNKKCLFIYHCLDFFSVKKKNGVHVRVGIDFASEKQFSVASLLRIDFKQCQTKRSVTIIKKPKTNSCMLCLLQHTHRESERAQGK